MLDRPSLTYPPSSFPEANNFFLKSTHPMISMLQSIFQNFPTNWNKNTSYQRIKWSQSYLRKIIYESAFIKLSLLIAEVITHLKSKDLDFGTRYQLDNLVAWDAPITAENGGNKGQCYCLWHVIVENTSIDVEVILYLLQLV